ncbi:MAG: sulfatase-like hydrolase/transferase [Acidobacteriota bacterium]|nr:sulfatase-like hydrolase/transferase [Acidobacteriota bacterium]
MIKRVLIALSLANLCFLPAWREVVDPGRLYHCYHTKICPVGVGLAAVSIDTLLLAALFFIGFELARRARRPLTLKAAYGAFLLTLLIPLNGLRIQFPDWMAPSLLASLGKAGFALVVLTPAALAALVIWRVGLARLARGATVVVLILSPFIGVAYAQSLWRMVNYRQAMSEQFAAARPESPRPARPPVRVLWLIFDELDYHVAFLNRPTSLSLPEFDRLRAEALFAHEAYPPAGLTTQSMPAFISGKLVADAKQTRPNVLAVQFHEESEWVGWATRPSIFSRARELGLTSAVVGWFHPYCRLFGRELKQCSWWQGRLLEDVVVRRSSVKDAMLRDAKMSFLSLPLLHRLLPRGEEPHPLRAKLIPQGMRDIQNLAARDYLEMMEEARRVSADPDIHLALVHLPIPHPPSFYDRGRGQLDAHGSHSYLDSLALADRSFGELRRALGEAGLWERTAVLISGDHWWRVRELYLPEDGQTTLQWHEEDETIIPPADEYRVPFILKLPGRTRGVEYGAPFNTVLSHDLVLSILRGEIDTPEAAAGWIDRHRSIGASPYYHVLLEQARGHESGPKKN